MGARKSELFLVKRAAPDSRPEGTFRTGETIPNSGIYQVIHHQHRLPHEVTLLRDEVFPRCAKCQDAVGFKLVRAARVEMENVYDGRMRISLYELPELDSETDEGQVAV